MNTIIPCELRDLDGSYLLVQPLGESRCRILASNVAPKGKLLYKPDLLSWEQATEDLGGYTRLLPDELLGRINADSVPDPENLVEALESHRELLSDPRSGDPEGDVVDPATLSRSGGIVEPDDPQAELVRQAIHRRNHHGRKAKKSRPAEVA